MSCGKAAGKNIVQPRNASTGLFRPNFLLIHLRIPLDWSAMSNAREADWAPARDQFIAEGASLVQSPAGRPG